MHQQVLPAAKSGFAVYLCCCVVTKSATFLDLQPKFATRIKMTRNPEGQYPLGLDGMEEAIKGGERARGWHGIHPFSEWPYNFGSDFIEIDRKECGGGRGVGGGCGRDSGLGGGIQIGIIKLVIFHLWAKTPN